VDTTVAAGTVDTAGKGVTVASLKGVGMVAGAVLDGAPPPGVPGPITVLVGVLVGGMGVGVGEFVLVGVGVGEFVLVGVGVGEFVLVGVGVGEFVLVGVFVGGTGVLVGELVGVVVGVLVDVLVGELVGVVVGVLVGMLVAELVATAVAEVMGVVVAEVVAVEEVIAVAVEEVIAVAVEEVMAVAVAEVMAVAVAEVMAVAVAEVMGVVVAEAMGVVVAEAMGMVVAETGVGVLVSADIVVAVGVLVGADVAVVVGAGVVAVAVGAGVVAVAVDCATASASTAPMVQDVADRGWPRWSTPPTAAQTAGLAFPAAAEPGPTLRVRVGPPLSANAVAKCGSPNWSWFAPLKPQVDDRYSRLYPPSMRMPGQVLKTVPAVLPASSVFATAIEPVIAVAVVNALPPFGALLSAIVTFVALTPLLVVIALPLPTVALLLKSVELAKASVPVMSEIAPPLPAVFPDSVLACIVRLPPGVVAVTTGLPCRMAPPCPPALLPCSVLDMTVPPVKVKMPPPLPVAVLPCMVAVMRETELLTSLLT